MKQRTRSIVIEWAGSYLLVLLIPLIAIITNFYLNTNIIRNEIYNSHEIVMENIGNEVDRVMKQQINVYNYLYMDVFFHSWVSHDEKNAEFYSDAARLKIQVQNFVKYTTNLSCLLYMPDENYLLHSEYADNASHTYTMLRTTNPEFVEYEKWIAMLSGEYNNEFIMLDCIDGRTNQRCLVYADSLELYGNKLVNVFISVPLKQILQLMDSVDTSTHFVMRSNERLEVIKGNEAMILPELASWEVAQEGNFETERYMGIIKESAYGDFIYCMLVPQTDFWTKAFYIRNLFIVIMVMVVIVAFIAVGFLLRRNFRPLNRLLELAGAENQIGNEYYRLEMSYSRLKSENKSMQQMKNALLGNFLFSIMQGRREPLSEMEMDFFGIKEKMSLILLGFQVSQEIELLRFAVDNVFSELMETESFCRMEEREYVLYLFFVAPEREKQVEETCNAQAQYLCELFLEKWKTSLRFKWVSTSEGLVQVKELYQRLVQLFLQEEGGQDAKADSNERIRGIVTYVLDYVEEHYADSDLNISSIANSINKNPKYISRVFKENTGEGVLDCINRIRISKAKEIIATRRYSAEEVGGMVGYASNQTFRRVFVKMVGMPPGKYMDIMCNNER